MKKYGKIGAKINQTGDTASLVEVHCNSHFVEKDARFQSFVDSVAQSAADNKIETINELGAAPFDKTGTSIDQAVEKLIELGVGMNTATSMTGRFSFGRLLTIDLNSLSADYLGCYSHMNRIAVLVAIDGGDETLAKDLAMHIAASDPDIISTNTISDDTIRIEVQEYTTQCQEKGIPTDIIEKKLEREIAKRLLSLPICLEQAFIKDPSKTVAQILKSKKAKLIRFVRMELNTPLKDVTENSTQELNNKVAKIRQLIGPERQNEEDPCIELIDKNEAEINESDIDEISRIEDKNSEYSRLRNAIISNTLDQEALESMISNGLNIDAKDTQDYTALWLACRYQKLEAVELIIKSGATLNYIETDEELDEEDEEVYCRYSYDEDDDDDYEEDPLSPLGLAVSLGNTQLVRLLLDNGADPQEVDPESHLPITSIAVKHPSIFLLLLDKMKQRKNKEGILLSKDLQSPEEKKQESMWEIFDGRNPNECKESIKKLISSDEMLKIDTKIQSIVDAVSVEKSGVYLFGGNADDKTEGIILNIQVPIPVKLECTSLYNWSYGDFSFRLKWTDQNQSTFELNVDESLDEPALSNLAPAIELAQSMDLGHLTLESFFRFLLFLVSPKVQLNYLSTKEHGLWSRVSPNEQVDPNPLLKEHFSTTEIKDVINIIHE